MNNYCVIALEENFQYKCIFCRHNDETKTTLENNYGSLSAAKCLIGLGDISLLNENTVRSYFKDWGVKWDCARPVVLSTQQTLMEYSRSAGIDRLYLFEDRRWNTYHLENNNDAKFQSAA